jgi:hypothetical protein
MFAKTVRIATKPTLENPLGFVIINETDFDEKKGHELFVAPEPPPPVVVAVIVPAPVAAVASAKAGKAGKGAKAPPAAEAPPPPLLPPEKSEESQVEDVLRAEIDGIVEDLPGEYSDPDYVVNAMRVRFGENFTAEDEAAVRRRVIPGNPPAADAASFAGGLGDIEPAVQPPAKT